MAKLIEESFEKFAASCLRRPLPAASRAYVRDVFFTGAYALFGKLANLTVGEKITRERANEVFKDLIDEFNDWLTEPPGENNTLGD